MKLKNFGRRFRRSTRAVSPVIAVLLMIVIAVASALFAYAWVMGYLDFLTVRVDQAVQVQSISYNATSGVLSAYVMNSGPTSVNIANVYVDDVLDPDADILNATDESPLTDGLLPSGGTALIESDIFDGTKNQVTVKVVTADGNIFMLKKTLTD